MKYYEKERAQCYTRLQDKAQNLLRENEVLKTLFDPSSVSGSHRDQSLTDRSKRPDGDWEGTSTRTQTPCLINFEYGEPQGQSLGIEASHTFTNIVNQPPLLAHLNGTELNQVAAPSEAFPGFAAHINDARVNVPTYFPTLSSFYDPLDTAGTKTMICDRFQPAYSLTLWPVLTDETAREDRSMLCSVAYRLILQFNKRQYDDMEIDIRIRCGFRLGRTQSEDCRVDIGVLFAVLAEISF